MRGDRLAKVREARGLSQAELGEIAGLSAQQIYRYENGLTKPDGDIVAQIAHALQVSTDYLLGVTESAGMYIDTDLNEREKAAIIAWRNGDKLDAIKTIIEEE